MDYQTILVDVMNGFIGSGISFSIAYLIWKVKERKFKGWTVKVVNGEKTLCERAIGSRKAKELLDDETTKSVYLKGLCSPFGWINIDIVSEEAKSLGLFKTKDRMFVVDLSKNPPKEQKSS